MAPHDTFPQRVWHIVASIPEGYVTTYGEVARLAGSPRAARQVGGVLKRLPEGSTLPWHRVVNRHGDISLTGPDLQRQRQALLAKRIDAGPLFALAALSDRLDPGLRRWLLNAAPEPVEPNTEALLAHSWAQRITPWLAAMPTLAPRAAGHA